MQRILLYAFLIISFTANAEIRYVSKTGTSTPPYTSWTTASDSIQKCINICNSGDTIYVGIGVYKEKIVMVNGISLIGSGMDSCLIDTRLLPQEPQINVIVWADNCFLEGFSIMISPSILP